MDAESERAAGKLLKQEATFVYDFFEATELEVRAMVRYVLVALGAMYSYLATTGIPLQYPRLAWYAPTLVTVIASIRALVLGHRQKKLLQYLMEMERRLPMPGGVPGWAGWFYPKPSFVAMTAIVFYVLLIASTLFIAYHMR